MGTFSSALVSASASLRVFVLVFDLGYGYGYGGDGHDLQTACHFPTVFLRLFSNTFLVTKLCEHLNIKMNMY